MIENNRNHLLSVFEMLLGKVEAGIDFVTGGGWPNRSPLLKLISISLQYGVCKKCHMARTQAR